METGRRDVENWDSKNQSENENVERSELEDNGSHGSSRKRRHTQHQKETMEAFFKDCPHPNEKERKCLSQALGLNESQVKFWFQNKRTQQKAQEKRMENTSLKTQNDKLRLENQNLKKAVNNVSCLKCDMPCTLGVGGTCSPLDKLKQENARLKRELESLQKLAKNVVDKSIWNDSRFATPIVPPRSLDLELGGSSFAGPLVSNSGEGLIFAANMQFNVAQLTHYDDQMTFQQKMESAYWSSTFTDDNFIKTKKPRLY